MQISYLFLTDQLCFLYSNLYEKPLDFLLWDSSYWSFSAKPTLSDPCNPCHLPGHLPEDLGFSFYIISQFRYMLKTSARSSGAFSFSGWRKLILSASSHMSYASANNLGGHPLDLQKNVHVSLVLRRPKLDTALQMLSHLCSTDWKISSFDLLATALLVQCMQLIFHYYSSLHYKSSLVLLGITCKLLQLPSIPQSRDMPAKYRRQLINTKLIKYLLSNGPIMSFIYRENPWTCRNHCFI